MDALTPREAAMGENLIYAPYYSPEGDISMKTEEICPSCAEPIVFTEDVVLLEVVQPRRLDGQLVRFHILDEEGDFLYQPYFIQFSPCWEEIEEWLTEELENEPPMEDTFSEFQCRYCKSGIREWEWCGSITMGEVHVSPRSPTGAREEKFVPSGESDLICLYCLHVINEGNIELWDPEYGGVTERNGECGDCLQARCWRSYPITSGQQAGSWATLGCDCACHLEDADNE
jgi:hypothetical protein